MRHRLPLLLIAFSAAFPLLAVPLLAAPLMETWEDGYTGKDATGPHVIAYWKFDGDSPEEALRDLSGNGHDLTLQGDGILSATGKSGGALESFPGFPVQSKRHAASTPHRPDLSPAGAFTLEMWIAPKADFEEKLRCYLLDKKYVDHTDYQWQLSEADKGGLRRMSVTMGFGSDSRTFHSEAARFETGVWRHLAFTYDGAGEGRFFIDGAAAGIQRHEGVAGPVPGNKPLSIGDRIGSNYGGFPGLIDEVRICKGVLAFEPVALTIASPRTVWERKEKAGAIEVTCTNLRRIPLVNATLRLVWSDGGATELIALPDLTSGGTHVASFPVDTSLRPDEYSFRARLELTEPQPFATEREVTFEIVARKPERMPVIMWGAGGGEIPRLKELGFTHFIGLSASSGEIWKEKKVLPPGDTERNLRHLDAALANGLEVVARISPRDTLMSNPANLRVGRDGKPYPRKDILASTPEFAPFFRNVGASLTAAYGDHPAFTMALVNSEVRDASAPSFNSVDLDNYRAFSGSEIPPEVSTRGGVEWTNLENFPENRVVSDDHPILNYYRWFWTVGDGWNALHTAAHEGLKEKARPGFRTFFDPAVRQPAIRGAGGNVDILSHWTYTYPDPQRIGLCADQLFAMAEAGGRGQEVMKMTQLIWYRSQTAPVQASRRGGGASEKPDGSLANWDDHDPDAAYITISPMHLREAFWTKLARPVRGIMYHGWQSLVSSDSPSAYRYTNPHTQHELKRLLHEVVQPLGPALLKIPDSRSEVAFFESFTSQIFARRGGYGWNTGWPADLWLALQHAHVPTEVIFEETLLKNGLEGRRFLIMPDCDVLTESVVKVIAEWQRGGGRIVADGDLCPGLKADITLERFKRGKKADEDKAMVLTLSRTLREEMGKQGFARAFDCDNPEIILRTRHAGDAAYVFAINDHREFGTYVGQHGLVMENGLPSSGRLEMPDGVFPHVYDLVDGMEISVSGNSIPLSLGPCDGRVFLMLPKALGGVAISARDSAKAGEALALTIQVNDTGGDAIKAVIPARVEIRDANGRLAEGSGFYGIENGVLPLTLDIAPNDDPGAWQITVRELASRRSATKSFQVTN